MADNLDAVEDQVDDSVDSAFTDAMEASAVNESSPPEADGHASDDSAPEPVSTEPEPIEAAVNEALEELLGAARESGLDVGQITSEADLARMAIENLRKQQPYVSYAQQILPHADEIRSYFNSKNQQAPQSQQKPEPVQGDEWNAGDYFQQKYGGPQWTEEQRQAIAAGFVERDPETGLWRAVPGNEMLVSSLLPGINQAQRHTQKFWQDLSSANPYEQFYDVLKEPLMKEVERRVAEIVASRETETRQRDVVSEFEAQHGSWMYAIDPQTGQRVTTDAGRAFLETVSDLRESGIKNPEKLLALASKINGIGGGPAPSPEAPVAPVQQSPPQPTKQESFLESAQRRAQHSPSARQRGGDDAPQVMSEGDLNSLFVRAFKETSRN